MRSTSPARNPLDLNGNDFSTLMSEVVPRLASFLDRLPDAPISMPDVVRAKQLRFVVPETGRPLNELLTILEEVAAVDVNVTSGGNMAYIPGSGLVSSAAADLIAAVYNRYTGIGMAAPAMVALEAEVIRWIADLIGFPASGGGLLTSGASMALFSAVVSARCDRLPDDFRRGVVYTTGETHLAFEKALHLAGFPREAIHEIPTDDANRMDVGALRRAIDIDRRDGRLPFMVAANAGTTNTGVIDPLGTLADIAREEQLWFHVDAAYGGFFQLTQRGRIRLAGIERADSVVLDPHKSLFLPFGTGCLLVRDEAVLARAHSTGPAAYLRDLDDMDAAYDSIPDFSTRSPELTRPNRGLGVWLPLQLHGVAAFREALDDKLDLAGYAYEALSAIPQLRLPAAPDLSIVAFHCRVTGGTVADEDVATSQLIDWVNSHSRVFLSTTQVRGQLTGRIAILNHRTTRSHVDQVVDMIRSFVAGETNRHLFDRG